MLPLPDARAARNAAGSGEAAWFREKLIRKKEACPRT